MDLKVYKQDCLFIIAIAVMLIWDNVFGCPTQFLTGISCPGCGMSRAVISLMHLRFEQALYYNPCVYELPLAVLLYLFRNRIDSKRIKVFFVFAFFAVYISVYIYRLYMGHQVLNSDISDGVIYKFLFTKE